MGGFRLRSGAPLKCDGNVCSLQGFSVRSGAYSPVMERWNPRRQGDIGELSAINWLIGAGALVSLPMFHSPDYDLIADFGERPLRVHVKTSIS